MGAGTEPLPLSVAVITLNEQANLDRCLNSVKGLAREVIVLDSGSTDRTIEIAQTHDARVLHADWNGFRTQKNRALAACTEPWVLSIDADEALSDALAADIRAQLMDMASDFAGYEINRRNWYLGNWIWHAWYPEWRLRLVRREHASWEGPELHEYLAVDGPTARLSGDLLHYSYEGIEDHFVRTVRYARMAADTLVSNGKPFRWHKLVFSPWIRLLQSLVVKQAWRDGWRGWVIAYSSMFAGLLKYAFVLEHTLRGKAEHTRDDDTDA